VRTAFASIVVDPPYCTGPRRSRELQQGQGQQQGEEDLGDSSAATTTGNGIGGSDGCLPACGDTEFCGTDDVCYDANCDNFYEKGNRAFTGYVEGSEPLACEVVSADDAKKPVSASFGCVGFYCAFDSEMVPFALFATRVCAANPQPLQSFVCYDVSPSDTDFQAFVGSTAGTDGYSCPDSDGFTTSPVYIYYQNMILQQASGGSTVINGPNSTDTFNETLASATFSSRLIIGDPTAAPTSAPTPPPTPPSASSSSLREREIAWTATFFALVGLVIIQ